MVFLRNTDTSSIITGVKNDNLKINTGRWVVVMVAGVHVSWKNLWKQTPG